jgi:dolichol-phosphate mannosyltransferase
MQDNPAASLELQVVMPVYNEQSTIATVIDQWCAQLDACSIRYSILALDDGSTDATSSALESLREKWGTRLEWVRQANSGHGPTILKGYQRTIQRQVPWIFQIDSDGQCDPQFFSRFWNLRGEYDFIAGCRIRREDGAGRVLVSRVLRAVVFLISGVNNADSNVPYRLMRTSAVAPLVAKIPETCFFTNVGLSVLAKKAGLRLATIPITFRARQGGTTTISYRKMGLHALHLYQNLRELLKN